MQRQAYRGQPAHIAKGREGDARDDGRQRLARRGMLRFEDLARRRWQDCRGGGQQDVEVAAPARDLPAAEQLERARGQRVVVGARLACELSLVGDVRLDGRPVDALVVGEATLRERDEGLDHLL